MKQGSKVVCAQVSSVLAAGGNDGRNQPRTTQSGIGIASLHDILVGGLSPGHVFLLEGNPSSGKTTIALRFLLQGAEEGEKCLYITLSETERELRAGAAS